MKEKTKKLTLLYLLFLLLIGVAGSVDGIVSDIIYYSAFIIPSALGMWIGLRDGNRSLPLLSIDGDGLRITALIAAPTVAVVWGVSYLTSLVILLLTGESDTPEVASTFWVAVLTSALLPALLEELLFRYVPMKLLSGGSARRILLLSALMFAVAHMNPFQLVYAFIAGVIFMSIDLVAGSVLPSVILHFVNNLVNVILIFYPEKFVIIGVIVTLCLLFVISLLFFLSKRREIVAKIINIFSAEDTEERDLTPLAFIVPAVVVAISVFF